MSTDQTKSGEATTEEGVTEDEQKLWNQVLNKFKFGAKNIEIRKLPQMWEKFERYYGNDYWYGSSRPVHLNRSSSNDLFEFVEVTGPMVTARPPMPDVIAVPPIERVLGLEDALQSEDLVEAEKAKQAKDDYYRRLSEWSNQLQKELVNTFEDTNMGEKSEILNREFSVKGTGIINSEFNKNSKTKIVNSLVDNLVVIPDPTKASIADCRDSWFIIASYILASEIKKTLGVSVDPEGDFNADGSFTKRSTLQEGIQKALSGEDSKDGYCFVIKMYMASGEEVEYDLSVADETGQYKKDEEGKVITEKANKAKYPNGRIVTIIKNYKDRIVKDEPCQYEDYWPYFEVANMRRAKDFWGTSDGKNMEQTTLDRLQILANVTDACKLMGNPQWVKTPGFEEEIRNEGGAVYTAPTTESIKALVGPPIPAYIQQHLQYLDDDRDKKSGVNDALRAQSNAGDSGVKTQALMAQATGRLNPRVRAFVDLYRRLYEHWAYIIRKFYDDPILQKEEDEEGKAVYTVFNPKEFEDVKIRIKINSLSIMPFDVFQEFEEATILFDKGLLSPEQYIESAPTLRHKQRAKDFVAERQEAQDREQMEAEALEQFRQLGEQMSEVVEVQDGKGSEDEDQIFEIMLQLVQQVPALIQTPEFQGLNERTKKALVSGLALGLGV